MTESKVRLIYMCLQFLGFMIQIFPALFLFFAPYRQEQMRVSRTKLLTGLSIATVGVSIFGALFLGNIFGTDHYEIRARLYGNLIFGVYLLIGTAIYFLVLKREVKIRVISYIMVLQYAVFLYMVMEITDKFNPAFLDKFGSDPYSAGTVISYVVATGLTCPFLYRFLKNIGAGRFRRVDQKSIKLITVSAGVMLAVMIFTLQIETVLNDKMKGIWNHMCLSAWLGCMIITGLLAYIIYFRCLQIEEEKADINMKLTTEEMQYKALREKRAEERKMHHNMRHHFRTLAVLAEERRYEELEDYLKKYLKEWETISDRNICSNPMINTILSYYFSNAEGNGISVEADINIREYYPFDTTDMTVLLGNAMENAVEACMDSGSGRPFIRVKIKEFKKAFLIQIENSCRRGGSPVINGDRISSTKKGRNGGYGISSMDMIAKKYQGSLECWKENDRFILRIALNIPEGIKTNQETFDEGDWKGDDAE